MSLLHPEPAARPPSLFRDALLFAWELVKVVGISLAIIIPIRYFLIQPFYVKGASMEPNFTDHEYLIIDEITYRVRQPKRGEVVVFRYPLNPRDYFIKRIIGLPGEQVQISDGRVLVTTVGQSAPAALDEPYLSTGMKVDGVKTVRLGDGEFFLMGDNRAESLDSRYFGAVSRRFITGRVFLRGWPLHKLAVFLEPPAYNVP